MDTNKIIEIIKNNNKKSKKSSYGILGIFLVFFVILIILYIGKKTTNYCYMSIICIAIVLVEIVVILLKDKKANQKIDEILKYKDDIDNYCEEVGNNVYRTKKRLLVIKPSAIKQVDFDNIVSCIDGFGYSSLGDTYTKYPTIIVTMSDNSKVTIESNDNIKGLLSKYYSDNNKDNKKTGEVIKSDAIKDLNKYDDYQQGYIDLPLFNKKECSLWIDSDVSVDYANKVASVIKELKEYDIDSAKESTVWYYNNDLKENGYHPGETNIPLKISKYDVLKYLRLEEIYIRKQDNNEIIYTIWFKTDMEPEHGISWMFKDKKNVYVGPGSDIDDKELNVNYNFAKDYHQEVRLTNEDYLEIEKGN